MTRSTLVLLGGLLIAMLASRSGVAEGPPPLEIVGESIRLHVDPGSGQVTLYDERTGGSLSLGAGNVLGQFRFQHTGGEVAINVGQPSASRVGFSDAAMMHEGDVSVVKLTLSTSSHFGPIEMELRYALHRVTGELMVTAQTGQDSAAQLASGVFYFGTVQWQAPSEGYIVLPQRQGAILPAAEAVRPTVVSLYHQGGLSMPFFGLVDGPSAWMITVEPIDGELQLSNSPRGADFHLTLKDSAIAFAIRSLPNGDYVDMAKAYRERAMAEGLFVSLTEKVSTEPQIADLIGAVDLKFFFEGGYFHEPIEGLSWLRQHHVEKALVIYAGWMLRGYDSLHPDVISYDVTWHEGAWRDAFGHIVDATAVTVTGEGMGRVILDAQPFAGGLKELQKAADQIREMGYLFGLHDNYQDIYADAPSFHPTVTLRDANGAPRKGGVWAGGQAYLLHPAHGLSFAQRNMEELTKVLPLDAYFVDTTTATPLYEDPYPESQLTKADDMRLRRELLDFLRSKVSVVGSETGAAWAVPHVAYFEGMEGSDLGISVPLFDLVFHDAVVTYRHQGNPDWPGKPERFLDALRSGRPASFTIWNRIPRGIELSGVLLEGWPLTLREYIRMASVISGTLHELTAFHPMQSHRFLTNDFTVEESVFLTDWGPATVVVNRSQDDFELDGAVLPQYGFVIESPTFVAGYVTRYQGVDLPRPTVFAVKALDGVPLPDSDAVQLYQADPDFPTPIVVNGVLVTVGDPIVVRGADLQAE